MNEEPFPHVKKLVVFAGLVFLTPCLFLFNGWRPIGADLGQAYGLVSALFSAAAFGGVIYTVRLQSKELELQRTQLARAAEAQEKSEKALTEQAASLAKQTASMELASKLDALQYRLQNYDWQISIDWGPQMRDGKMLQPHEFKSVLVNEKQRMIYKLDELLGEAFGKM
jgi:hypothetical protein